MESWPALPDTLLPPDAPLCADLQRRGLSDLRQVGSWICSLPYGRTSPRHDFRAVLEQGCGTCSTKHALLAAVAAEAGVDLQLTVGMYAMSEANTPGVGAVLDAAGLASIPEAHCYVVWSGRRIDITRPPDKAASSTQFEPQWAITSEQIGQHKVDLHRRHLQDWLGEQPQVMLGLDELWAVREACIAALCRRRSAPSTPSQP